MYAARVEGKSAGLTFCLQMSNERMVIIVDSGMGVQPKT